MDSSSRIALILSAIAPITFLFSSASTYVAEATGPAIVVSRLESVGSVVQARISALSNVRNLNREQRAIIDYYTTPEMRLLWVDETGLSARAKSVIDELEKADEFGLRATDYDLPGGFDATSSAEGLADTEIAISLAVLRYARDARGGRLNPLRLSKNLDITLGLPDPRQVIESIAINPQPESYLRNFHPDQPQFGSLRQKLIELRQEITDRATTFVKIPEGPLLKLGVAHEQVPLLRQRLDVPSTAEGGVTSEILFDEAVLGAVKQFQTAHGVPADGVVGPSTRRMLNQQDKAAANKDRIRLIELNMERWRWLPDQPEAFYVTVNVPEFVLRVITDGKQIFTAPVVVGAPNTQTPIFSATMEEIVFNPYWNVPNSIKTEELLPYMRGNNSFAGGRSWNTSVLKRNNLRVSVGGRPVDPSRLDWNRIDIRSLNIYQPPGPDNVLGELKFVFPNKHDVYMHDTPLKFLFSKPTRAESHGCVRLQHPDQFALMLLGRDQNWTSAEIATAIETGHDQRVALQHKVPVHITYFTIWVDDDGSISTFRDLYGHDARMAAALFGESVALGPVLGAERSRAGRLPDPNRGRQRRDMTNGIAESLSGFLSNF